MNKDKDIKFRNKRLKHNNINSIHKIASHPLNKKPNPDKHALEGNKAEQLNEAVKKAKFKNKKKKTSPEGNPKEQSVAISVITEGKCKDKLEQPTYIKTKAKIKVLEKKLHTQKERNTKSSLSPKALGLILTNKTENMKDNKHQDHESGEGNVRYRDNRKLKKTELLKCKDLNKDRQFVRKDNSERKRLKRLLWKQKQTLGKLNRRGLMTASDKEIVGKKQQQIREKGNRTASDNDKPKEIQMLTKSKRENVHNAYKKETLQEKSFLPKTAEEAMANWKKLQETVLTPRLNFRKRKIPKEQLRNPKLICSAKKEEKNETEEEREPEIWFDDVDDMLLDSKLSSAGSGANKSICMDSATQQAEKINPLIKSGAYRGVTKIVAMDCEMVGVGDGSESVLARVSIVNQFGEPLYDKFVRPKEKVVDYRTSVSGVRPEDLKNAEKFETVQREVDGIIRGKILVGHAIKNDLKVLYLGHPRRHIRDTSTYKPFRQLTGGRTPSLKKLSEKVLAVKVQEGEHNSIQDAQAAMRLYTMHRKQWENYNKTKKIVGQHKKRE